MRKAQINIAVELFDDQTSNGEPERITVYADSQNLFETIYAGFQELTIALNERKRARNGVQEHTYRTRVYGSTTKPFPAEYWAEKRRQMKKRFEEQEAGAPK